ncbi:MAG: helix-turn-helix domain-containing protein [Chloroflexi bacterium]|uniref:LexA family protein n=1 Tax=Candidatus Flexifilum breve TaxID=3140694 RepID=UPI003134D877|nr:helix-turn-helix domain-containing protein [Chloroflexota bacterium]
MGETTEKVYCFIRDYVGKHGKAPSYAQIAEACGIRPGTVGAHLSYLEARGLIRRADNTRRGITLLKIKSD